MPRCPDRLALTTVRIPHHIYTNACEAARDQLACHVTNFLRVYHGDIWELAIGCYFQGLQDATQLDLPRIIAEATEPTP